MLLLAHLLNLNPDWANAQISLKTIVNTESERKSLLATLSRLVADVRIRAKPDIILKPEGKSVIDVMREASSDSDVVFFGLQIPEPGSELDYANRLIELAGNFRAAIFVRNAGAFAGELL